MRITGLSSSLPPAAFLATLLVLAACQSQPDSDAVTLFIDKALVDCEGVAPQKCMRIKTAKDSEWRYFYDRIDNFEHEAGCDYELLVNISQTANPPADASSKRYVLVKEVQRHCDAPAP